MKAIPGLIIAIILVAAIACSDNPTSSDGVIEPQYESVELRMDESTRIDFARTTVAVDSIVDTRCPINAYCVAPGNASAGLTFDGTESRFLTIPDIIAWGDTSEPSNYVIRNDIAYFLAGVSPYPGAVPPDSVDQKAHLAVLSLKRNPQQVIPIIGYGPNYEIDPVQDIDSLKIDDNQLSFWVIYGGGCQRHTFALLLQSMTPRLNVADLYLMHYDRGDVCRALPYQTLTYDLTPIRDQASMWDGPLPGDITLILHQPFSDATDTIIYTPTPD